ASEEEGGRTRGTGVVDVDDRNARHADLIERLLTRSRIADHEAHISLLYRAVIDARIGECLARRLDGHRIVRGAPAGFAELDHAHARYQCFVLHVVSLPPIDSP